MRRIEPKTLLLCFVASLVIALGASVGSGQESPKGQIVRGRQLAEALRAGGYVVYFRHAATNSDQVDAEKPDFARCELTDYGDTIRFGDYEATAEAILYEQDPEYRRRAKKVRRAEDQTFGGSLRRLRLQRGLRRSELGISEKEVARLERGEIGKPHEGTLAILAKHLGVRTNEIHGF